MVTKKSGLDGGHYGHQKKFGLVPLWWPLWSPKKNRSGPTMVTKKNSVWSHYGGHYGSFISKPALTAFLSLVSTMVATVVPKTIAAPLRAPLRTRLWTIAGTIAGTPSRGPLRGPRPPWSNSSQRYASISKISKMPTHLVSKMALRWHLFRRKS